MKRGMVSKSIIIFLVILFAIILILPTVGTKEMEILLSGDIKPEEAEVILKRFSSNRYDIKKAEGKILVKANLMGITDAVMNEAKLFPGVKDAKILPHWAEKYVLAKSITFGLDLQGGTQLVMMADFDKIAKQYTEEKNQLIEKKKSLEAKLTEKGNTDKDKVKDEITHIDYSLKDINNNILTGEGKIRDQYKYEITQRALEMLRNRVDRFGVAEPSILQRGNEIIEIQLPGVKDPKTVKNLIGTTGAVQYRLVDDASTNNVSSWLAANYKNKKLPESKDEQEALLTKIANDIKLSPNMELLFHYNRDERTKKIYPSDIYALQKIVALSGNDINRASVGRSEYGELIVQFSTTAEGAEKLAKVTAPENRGKRMAIIIDNKIRSAPSLRDQIASGSGQITGSFTPDEVTTLARIIQEGALPVDLTVAQEITVGPSLGQDAIDSGILFIIIGSAGIMIYMLFRYKLSGVIANITLILNEVFVITILSWLGFTLTFPGIAAMVLNLGMAVDSNVIIYERIKEEIASGKSVKIAMANGFDRVFYAIFDSNLTTLIAAFVLLQFGTGFIKGFAVTLAVGVVSTMFVALYVTKYFFELIALKKNIKKLSI